MKLFLFIVGILCVSAIVAQDTKLLMKEAANAERNLDETTAIDKYRQVIAVDPNNVQALVRLSTLYLAAGLRTSDKKEKASYLQTAFEYGSKAVDIDSSNADAYVALALVNENLALNSTNNKVFAGYLKSAVENAEKAYAIDSQNGYAAYALGHIHFEVVKLSALKRTMFNNVYEGGFKGNIDSAILYFERSKTLLPYFVRNFLELAQAYIYNNRPEKALEILNQTVKLPNRTIDDKALKAEAQALLKSML